jgi:hypothetical protein
MWAGRVYPYVITALSPWLFLPDKDRKLKLRNKIQISLTIIIYQVMCVDMEYPYAINVNRILLDHFTQKCALIGLIKPLY